MADIQELQARVQELNETTRALIDRWEIEELKARYFRLFDAQDWDGWRALFTDDLKYDFGDGVWHDGADGFVAIAREMADGKAGKGVTVHRGHMPELVVDSPTEAHGLWVLADYLEWPSDDGQRHGAKGYGHEYEDYRKEDGVWKIATWRLSYIRLDPLRREPLPEKMLGGTADLEDESYIEAVTSKG
jgi:hypothetical protein